ncbi:MAG TPA: hypothetical protein VHZ95_04040 [Polyangiales bacterium]|jgi:hypothetical protein|nr:hypothetical protein [Polyangiales bacterium]
MTSSSRIMEALAEVAREVPEAHTRMTACLVGREIVLEFDGEITHFSPSTEDHRRSVVHVISTLDAIGRVLRGEDNVIAALVEERLRIVAAPDDLIAAGDALTWFLQGAVRSVAVAPIADDLFPR